MKGRVIFFPGNYRPPHETWVKLLWYQDQYNLYHAELNYKIKELRLDRFQEVIYRQNSHAAVRDTWKLIVNDDYVAKYDGYSQEIV